MSIALPSHNEDKVRLINAVFGKTPEILLANCQTEEETNEKMRSVAVSQFGIIKQEVEEAYDAESEDDARDALADILVTVFGMPYLLGMPRQTPLLKAMIVDPTKYHPIHRNLSIRDIILTATHDPRAVYDRAYLSENDEALAIFRKNAIGQLAGPLTQLEKTIEAEGIMDFDSIAEACGQLVVAAHNLSFFAGCNIDTDMDEVCSKLLSRLCNDEEHAEETRAYYLREKNVKCGIRESEALPGKFVVYSAEDQTCLKGDHYPENKFMKALGFGEPVFAVLYAGDDEPILGEEEATEDGKTD